MSYLVLASGIPPFSKAVISLWFRFPQSSVDETVDEWDALPSDKNFYVLPYTIPLLTWGEPLTGQVYEGEASDISSYPYGWPDPLTGEQAGSGPPIYDTPSWSVVNDEPLSPSFVGLVCNSRTRKAYLAFNLQMENRALLSAAAFNRDSVEVYAQGTENPFPPPGYSDAEGSGWSDGGARHTSVTDTSYHLTGQPEYFYVESAEEIKPDEWHHLLVSFDLTASCETHATAEPEQTIDGTSSYCKLWYAIDDEDYRGGEDDPFWTNMGPFGVDGGDPNGILSYNAYRVAHMSTGTIFGYPSTPGATCSFKPDAFPSADGPFGIPASDEYVERIKNVIMAEFQFFTDVTLDTKEDKARRAFVDSDGKPVPPIDAENYLHKQPKILLHGSSNWRAGKNTGSLGVDALGKAVLLKKTGVIDTYKPEPSLEGTTSAPEARSSVGPVQLTKKKPQNARL